MIRAFRFRQAPATTCPGLSPADRLKNNFFGRMAARRGQVAVVMILIIAIGLIFYAVVLNLGRISQTKTITLIAAETTAAQLASFMASYGQKVFEEALGGRRKVCGWTALFTALIMVVVIIIIIIIIVVSWGTAAPAAMGTVAAAAVGVSPVVLAVVVGVMLVLALSFAIASVALQQTVVEPGITAMWNRLTQDYSITEQFVERGIQTALGSSVTDQGRIPDIYDYDGDTFFGYDNSSPPKPNDRVSRFGIVYAERLKSIPPPVQNTAIKDFVDALEEFIDQGTDDWGLYDQMNCSVLPSPPAECNPCCQPKDIPNPTCAGTGDRPDCCACPEPAAPGDPVPPCPNPECTVVVGVGGQQSVPPECCNPQPGDLDCREIVDCKKIKLRPDCCDLAAGVPGKCGDVSECNTNTPYYHDDNPDSPANDYPWVYDPHYEDPTNGFLSFREKIGRDDEHKMYRTFVGTLEGVPFNSFAEKPVRHEVLASAPDAWNVPPPSWPWVNDYNIQDTSGFYTEDERFGIFPFLYKTDDWGVNLNLLAYSDDLPGNGLDAVNPYRTECFWCDTGPGRANGGACLSPLVPDPNFPNQFPPRLDLGASGLTGALYAGGWCVDNVNRRTPNQGSVSGNGLDTGDSPALLDKVVGLDTILVAPRDQCTIWNPASVWKRGADRFCARLTGGEPMYPYHLNCSKHRKADGTPCQDTTLYTDPDTGLPTEETFDISCLCGDPDPAAPDPLASDPANLEWPEDKLDNFIYGSPVFVDWAKRIIDTPITALVATFEDWYPDAAYWIEPLCPDPNCSGCSGGPDPAGPCMSKANGDQAECHNDPCPGSYTNKIRDYNNDGIIDGRRNPGPREVDWSNLHQWRQSLEDFNTPIQDWISHEWVPPAPGDIWDPVNPDPDLVFNRDGTVLPPPPPLPLLGTYVGDSCLVNDGANDADTTWCVPPATPGTPNRYNIEECGCVTPKEAKTFDINNNGVRGDLEDVTACLDYNVKDPLLWDHDNDPNTPMIQAQLADGTAVAGNYLKFLKCKEQCNRVNCTNLPRSLVPEFCGLGFIDPGDSTALQNCLGSADVTECAANCPAVAQDVKDATGAIYDPPDPPDMTNWNKVQSCVNECNTGNFSSGTSCGAFCGAGAFPATVTCYSPADTRNDFENAACGLLGSCCDFPPIMAGQNDFYDALQTATSGICGADWKMEYPTWGLDVPFIAQIHRAMGSCYNDNNVDNPMGIAIQYAHDVLATDPVLDAQDRLKLEECWTARDATGCPDPPGPCQELYTNPEYFANAAGVLYRLPPWEDGILNYTGNPICPDSNVFIAMKNCLLSCSETNCWADIDSDGNPSGYNMPTVNCEGEPLGLDPAPQLKNPLADDPGNQALINSCLSSCVINFDSCQQVDAIFGLNLYVTPIPPNDSSYATRSDEFIAQCSDSATCLANGCDGMPYTLNGLSRTFFCSAATAYRDPLELCASNLENSCSWWGYQNDPSDNPFWHDAAVDALTVVSGSCADISPGGFRELLDQSVIEARVQVQKMQKRVLILKDLLQDALNISYASPVADSDNPYMPDDPNLPPVADYPGDPRFFGFENQPGLPTPPAEGGVLAEGIKHFTRFLDNGTAFYDVPLENANLAYDAKVNRYVQDSPAEKLIDARMRMAEDAALPAVAIYAWKDEDKVGQIQGGRWHIVKVEVRTPRRCNFACGVDGGPDPEWPRVGSYTVKGGLVPILLFGPIASFLDMERCYDFQDTDGMTKARVVRWDQDKSWNPLKFPDGTPLWNIQLFHPQRRKVSFPLLASGNNDGSTCIQQVSPTFFEPAQGNSCSQGGQCTLYPWGHAFMLSKVPLLTAVTLADQQYINCWNTVHSLLENGVVSESCAQYYFTGHAMKIKFVPCDDDFTKGLN